MVCMCVVIATEMPNGDQGGENTSTAEYKYATSVQWSVMWYSETSAGCKMAVMVGGASCWAENRSQDLADLRSRTSREQLVGERGRGGVQKEWGSWRVSEQGGRKKIVEHGIRTEGRRKETW